MFPAVRKEASRRHSSLRDAFLRTVSTASPLLESLPLSKNADSAVLVRLPEQLWGHPVSLSSNTVQSVTGGRVSKIGVVREAFQPELQVSSLSNMLKGLSDRSVAVHSSLRDRYNRVVVDEYACGPDGDYHLTSNSIDLFRYLHGQDVRVSFVPHLDGSFNSVRAGSNPATRTLKQSTNEVLMVAPTAFGFNPQAAQDNSFMNAVAPSSGGTLSDVTVTVLKEFSALYHELTEVAGVKVNLWQHSVAHDTPDACFPNNWFSTHPAGEALGGVAEPTLVYYPMKCPNRAAERRADIMGFLQTKGYSRVLDLSAAEAASPPKYFEGTGVLVNDRMNGVAYVAISERAHRDVAEKWAEEMGYKELVTFHSTDTRGNPVYHTNVMMAIGTDVAIVCAESVVDDKERNHLLARLRATHEVVEITQGQMAALCGNALELENGLGLPVMSMSTQAYNAFTPEQRSVLRRHCADLVHAPIDTLERIGGGSVRCTLAEIF